MLAALRPKPFRGDQVAAGTVILTVLVLLVDVRFSGRWADGTHLAYTAAAALFVLGMSVAAPREAAGPPAWHATLYVSGFALTLLALVNLAKVLGSDVLSHAGTATWVGVLLTALATWMSRARGAASGTLLAGLTAVLTTIVFLSWAGNPDAADYRRILLLDVVVLTLMALWQRIRGPAHGVQLLNVVAVALLGIPATFVLGAVPTFFLGGGSANLSGPDIGAGWTALVFAGGIGVLAAGAADRERGNVVLGILLLIAFVAMAGTGDLLWWPLLLAAAAVTLLVIGLRPSTPLPPEPPQPVGPPAPLLPVS